ncbi:MAG: response regulator [Burkholderiales bacterium]
MPKDAKNKILIVDDDPEMTDYLSLRLRAGFTVVAINEPLAALQLARDERPDLILCDVTMPDLDGYELCRQIKDDPVTADTPVIFLTSTRTDMADESRGLKAGAVDYLNKTLDSSVLEARLRLHLALRDAQRALKDQNVFLEATVAKRTAELEASREALREAMHNLRTTRVTAGVYWVQVPEAGLYILCGCPGDVVKHLMLRGLIVEERTGELLSETGPNVILLSDVLVQNGSFANLSEFPVLQMLYRQGMMLPGHPNNNGRKPMLVGSAAQVRSQLDYIYRGNYGLVSEDELRAAGLGAEEARRQMTLKLRFAFGKIQDSEGLVDARVIGDAPAELGGGVSVRRSALNRFEFSYRGRTSEVNLNLAPGERYEAPYTPGQHPIEPQYFGIIHCGEGDGWDPRRQSMGSIVMFQARYYLVDAGPGILDTLRSLGIDLSEIEGVFHTHAHDDHFAGIPTLLASGRRIKYFATPVVRASVTKKLSALISVDENLFTEFFEVRDLVPDQWNDCDGMEVMPQHSPHPVENTIFMFRVQDNGGYKTYAHWADIVSMKVLRRLIAAPPANGILHADYADEIQSRYLTPATLKKIDGGGGMIHGEPLDFAADTSEKIVLAHRTAAFSDEELEIGSQAIFGAVDVLVASTQDYQIQRAYRYLMRIFPESSLDELNALVRAPVSIQNAGSLILRRGQEITDVFLLISGSVEVSNGKLGAPLTVACGTLIGLESLFQDEPPQDSWRAASPVRLLPISAQTLRTFLLNSGLFQRLRSLLADTTFLRASWLFGERLPLSKHEMLAQAASAFEVPDGQTLAVEAPGAATLYVLRRGAIVLQDRNGTPLEHLGTGGFVGEEACLGRPQPPWNWVAKGDCEILSMEAIYLRGIPVVQWKMLETHERRLRSAELI